MPKHRLSLAPLPLSKRPQGSSRQKSASIVVPSFDSVLSDELVLVIFAYLSFRDLCAIQPTNHHWARLAIDNELWKSLFVREYGRSRLRGSRGFIARHEGREIKTLPRELYEHDRLNWKWMFRVSSNWRKGRCELEHVETPLLRSLSSGKLLHSCVVIAGSIIVTTLPTSSLAPPIYLHQHGSQPFILTGRHRSDTPAHITALSLDQSPPSPGDTTVRLAAFYDTGEFTLFSISHSSAHRSRRLITYFPYAKSDRTTPIRQAVYHHPLLVTLSHAFCLSLYNLLDNNIVHTQTLTSYSSFPPTSMVLTPGPNGYRLVLAYSAPVYPAHWNAAVTVLTISSCCSDVASTGTNDENNDSEVQGPCIVTSTRSVRAYDNPTGWHDTRTLRLMREQWGRKAARVADIQTDGKWVIIAPADALPPSIGNRYNNRSRIGTTACALQLYRLHVPSTVGGVTSALRMTFVRTLHGHSGPVAALALADGRCVSLGVDGSIWVWDLERGWGSEVQAPRTTVSESSGTEAAENLEIEEDTPMGAPLGAITFDERRIITAGAHGIEDRRFDI